MEADVPFDQQAYSSGKRKSAVFALLFMLTFTVFNSCQNMQSTIYANLGYTYLGNISLFCLYFTFGICAIFSGVAIQRFNYNYKIIILVSSLGYDAFMAAGVWVSAC